MPVRAFLDSDRIPFSFDHDQQVVSMPVRAFLDSDFLVGGNCILGDEFQCPSGHFLIQTRLAGGLGLYRVSFNARQGIS